MEHKQEAYGFDLDYEIYSTLRIPFRDVEISFNGDRAIVMSKEPKTIKEFENIFKDYMKKRKDDEENTLELIRKTRRMEKEEELID